MRGKDVKTPGCGWCMMQACDNYEWEGDKSLRFPYNKNLRELSKRDFWRALSLLTQPFFFCFCVLFLFSRQGHLLPSSVPSYSPPNGILPFVSPSPWRPRPSGERESESDEKKTRALLREMINDGAMVFEAARSLFITLMMIHLTIRVEKS